MSARKKVVILGDLNTELPEYKQFAEKYECIPYTVPSTRAQVVADFQGPLAGIDAIYGAWLGFVLVGGFNDELVANAPDSLKVISICSVGHDHYHGQQMKERGVCLTNVPLDGAAGPVADLVLYNTLAAFRHFQMLREALQPKNNHTVAVRRQLQLAGFDASTGAPAGGSSDGYAFGEHVAGRPCLSPRGHHAVIVGFGNIGRTIGGRLALLGMHIHYVKRTPLGDKEALELGYAAEYHASLASTVSFADLVVIACPATPETIHMVDAPLLALFARPVRIINIGRGPIIDEQALVDALQAGQVLFAGLDVFEDEPRVHPGLFGRQDVFLTPHVGALTVDNFDYTAVAALRNIDLVLLGQAPESRVN